MMFRRETFNKFKRAQALIIALFVMMALSLIAWTVVNFSAADLNMGARLVDSERALYLAEAGSQWALNQSNSNANWCSGATFLHTLGRGQYSVTCSNASGAPLITSTGYVPSQSACNNHTAACLGTRVVQQGSGSSTYINKLIQAYKNFDWSGVNLGMSPKASYFDGDIAVGSIAPASPYGFKGPGGNANTPNELGIDYSNNSPLLPPSTLTPLPSRADKAAYPGISLDILRNSASAGCYWPGLADTDLDRNLRVSFAVFNLGNMWGVANDLAQSFQVTTGGANYTVDNIRILHGQNYPTIGGAPTGNVIVEIRRDTAGTHVPNMTAGGLIATATYTPVASSWNSVSFVGVSLGRGTTYWLVLRDAVVQNYETRYTIRAGYYVGPYGLLFGSATNWSGAQIQSHTILNVPTDPELVFEIRQGNNVQTGADRSYVYIRSLPFVLGDINNVEYNCAQSFKIRPWWPSSTVTSVGTRHRLYTGNPAGPITVQIQTDVNNAPSGTLADPNAHTTYTPANAQGETYANFSSAINLNYDQQYWLVWSAPNQATNNYYQLSAAGYKYGSASYRSNNGAGWSAWSTPNQPALFFNLTLQSGDTIGITSDSYFFNNPADNTGVPMVGEALKNYAYDPTRSLTGAWNTNEWGLIGSVADVTYYDIAYYPGQGNDPKYASKVQLTDASGNPQVVDWMDTDEVQLAHRFNAPDDNNTSLALPQNWYVAAGIMFDVGVNNLNMFNRSFTAERDIGIVGTGSINLEAPVNANAPLLASEFGNIYSTAPSTQGNGFAAAQRRTLAGLVYTNTGNVTFNYLCSSNNDCPPAGSSNMGAAVLGANVTMTGYIYMNGNSTRVNKNGSYLTGSGGASSWQEQ